MKRDEIKGTVTLSIADFDALTEEKEVLDKYFQKENEKLKETRKGLLKGMVKFILPYYGSPWDEGALWYKENEAIQKVVDIYKKRLDEEQQTVAENISGKTYWELIKWKRRMDKDENKRWLC